MLLESRSEKIIQLDLIKLSKWGANAGNKNMKEIRRFLGS
jgi:hypothetical protein